MIFTLETFDRMSTTIALLECFCTFLVVVDCYANSSSLINVAKTLHQHKEAGFGGVVDQTSKSWQEEKKVWNKHGSSS